MRLAGWYRVVATLLAFWLPLVMGEPALVYPCPMHSPAPMQHAMAHHHDSAPHGNDRHQCVCVGCCASAAATYAPVASIVTIVVAQSRDAGTVGATRAQPSDTGHLLGLYTTGPPVVAPVL
jgi:hypothetical protein